MQDHTNSGAGSAGIATLVRRAKLAVSVIIATMAAFALTLCGELLELAGVIEINAVEVDTLATAYAVISLLSAVVFIISAIFVAMWIYRAHANLHEAGIEGLGYTPGWAVGWYFVPFANLFKPFQAMRELWSQSHGAADGFAAEAPGNLNLWWGTWIVGNILGNISARMTMAGEGGNQQVAVGLALASSVCTIVSAYLLLQIIREVTAAQVSGISLAQVFE